MSDFSKDFAAAAVWIDRYFHDARSYRVLSNATPGALVDRLPERAPEEGESFERIFADFEELIVPGITHWNHPRFFAYFAISAAPIAVIAEALAATLDVNAMLWRTSPAATELEEVTTRWLRDLIGLDSGLEGVIFDTASTGGFTALAAARESLGLEIRERGMTGRPDLPPLRLYITGHTHSHIEKAAIALGIGRENVVKVPVDETFAMRPAALETALREDIARGMRPMCVAATVGTTSTTACDALVEIAGVARRFGVWLHVDAAYAGPAAMLPEFRHLIDGCEHADSVVVNPHKWLFVPVDLSVLYVRDLENLRRTFSLVADYLTTDETGVRNLMDYGLPLGRRFRALKLWFVLRYYGAEEIRRRLRGHIERAQNFARWVGAEAGWLIDAPYPLSVVCFHFEPEPADPKEIDRLNERIVERVNRAGEVFLSTTRLNGRVTIRLAIGNLETSDDDVALAWRLLREAALEEREACHKTRGPASKAALS